MWRGAYNVIFVPFASGRPSGLPIDILTGILDQSGDARGRPVGVAPGRSAALLVADDVGNRIWRVRGASLDPAIAAGGGTALARSGLSSSKVEALR